MAGIRVIMITGDYKETALHVAGEIGLSTDGAITGDEFENMGTDEKATSLRRTSIFSRVRPNQKLLIVRELKQAGEVVAMTGDGVNDAPALKEAHIGIAMGKRGTDVAREASAIVLLDDNFNSIVAGIKMGRRIYDNLQKAINYLIAVHIPVVILSILPVVFGKPLILMPIHIVFLEMIIDPTCTIVFEADKEDSDIMTIQGLVVGATLFAAYMYSFPKYGEEASRTFTFILLVALVVMLILSNLSRKENVLSKLYKNDNTALVVVLLVTLFIMYLATNLRAVTEVFRFAQLTTTQLLEIASIALLFLFVTEVIKLLSRTVKLRIR
jgi:Ca2+-transporting ATPase